MDQSYLNNNVDTLFKSLENFTQTEGIIGKAVTQGDKTFLPVVSITVGYLTGITPYVTLVAYPIDGRPFVALAQAGRVSSNNGMNSIVTLKTLTLPLRSTIFPQNGMQSKVTSVGIAVAMK